MSRDPLAWLTDELAQLERDSLLRTLRVRAGRQEAVIELDNRTVINFGSNDYLGLAGHPQLAQAAIDAAECEGWGSGASPLIVGRSRTHADLEKRLAEFEQTEAALVFNTGFAANVSTIAALVSPGDAIFSDELNHASIVDGCRLSKAATHIYRHADVEHLAQLLREHRSARRKLIVTDTLFSMDGDLAPLPDLVELAARHDAMLMVDEAHATGVFGANGRGVAEHCGLDARTYGEEFEPGIAIRVGTLSKALGGSGGFVAGSWALIHWLTNRARSYVFSTAPPAACCAASIAALGMVVNFPERREQLLAKAAWLREQLQNDGWDTGRSASQIIPIIIGDAAATMRLAVALFDRGFFVPGIRPPSVPIGRSLLRLSLSYAHTDAMLAGLLETLRDLRRQGVVDAT
ncbi:MAG: 8-amino-7-oxononanoate synthase [Planctomycetaceae bacterium]|nr:8-amino-7-oxononanoate synthase [Planctomycetaceae bacterium]